MASTKKLTKKLYYGIGIGVLGIAGITTGILVPVLSKDDDSNRLSLLNQVAQIKNAQSKDEMIKLVQVLYGLDFKTLDSINKLSEKSSEGKERKQQYKSAAALGRKLFSNKDLQMHFKSGQEETSKLKQLLLTITPQNASRRLDLTSEWPASSIDEASDKAALLLTFFKGKVISVANKLQSVSNDELEISFSTKTARLFEVLRRFKLASLAASAFSYYNAYLDQDGSTGLSLFKNYLLTLDTNLQLSDLTGARFTKIDDPTTNKTRAMLSFSHEGITISKDVNDFVYNPNEYNLRWKVAALSKIANEIVVADIDASQLPLNVTIASVAPSLARSDGSTVTITFSGGKVQTQEFGGLINYQRKAQAIIKQAANDNVFVGANDPVRNKKILPSAYQDKQALINMFKTFASIFNDTKYAKVNEVLDTALIILAANNKTGILQFQIALANVSATFTISGFDTYATNVAYINQKIDAEVAKKTMPTIKPGSKLKTGYETNVLPADIVIRAYDKSLNSRVLSVRGIDGGLEGSIVIVTIEVSSPVVGTKKLTYQVELSGFANVRYASAYWLDLLDRTTNANIGAIISNKSLVLASTYLANNHQPIRNLLKKQVDLLKNNKQTSYIKNFSSSEIIAFKKLIDNNMRVIASTNDQAGILTFTITLFYDNNENSKTFTISGFQTIT